MVQPVPGVSAGLPGAVARGDAPAQTAAAGPGSSNAEETFDMAHPFFWYELVTTDVDAAKRFYEAVVGWKTEPFEGSDGGYTILKTGETPVGGLMAMPAEAAGMPPAWMGYVFAEDVDAATKSIEKAGGAIHKAASDIPGVGRFAVVADPQGAAFMLMAPQGEAPVERPAPGTPGHVGWRELHAGDLEAAKSFYSGQFGWTMTDAVPMGEMGDYQLFDTAEGQSGGMMRKPAEVPAPFWVFYFNVDGIDAAAERVRAAGGTVVMEPMEVPGGDWVLQGADPQGAFFGLLAPGR